MAPNVPSERATETIMGTVVKNLAWGFFRRTSSVTALISGANERVKKATAITVPITNRSFL
ncbi:hypothetical protein CTI12_AA082060 [Artemisia annua]|uniref:Uncharacterized protein n=1 Tax=Artemisia annua TaxID=35608 RepID=A0A2U1Q2P8_ARTAN|nr:hypothetical protein CTI12_AA082060 [Artemisia annua]